eukprot:Hpha_TRINITY_DN4858_c0_g1::TRINITY_DN4858_c0_g1_i1::g.20371::m.20371
MAGMTVFVHVQEELGGAGTLGLDVGLDDTVGDLRRQAEQAAGLRGDNTALVLHGEILADATPLADTGIGAQEVIQLTLGGLSDAEIAELDTYAGQQGRGGLGTRLKNGLGRITLRLDGTAAESTILHCIAKVLPRLTRVHTIVFEGSLVRSEMRYGWGELCAAIPNSRVTELRIALISPEELLVLARELPRMNQLKPRVCRPWGLVLDRPWFQSKGGGC